MDNDPLIMYVIINKDLKMTPGKVAAQVGHVTQFVIEQLVAETYESAIHSEHCINYMKWKGEPTKVILRGTTEELLYASKRDDTKYMFDPPRPDAEPKMTAVAFFPSNTLGKLMKKYDLYTGK